MQTKQHAKRKQHSYSNRKKIYKEQFVFVFVVEGSLAGNVQNTGFFKIQLVGSVCSILSVFLEVLVFLCARNSNKYF